MGFPASRTKMKKLVKGRRGEIKVHKMQITSLVDMMTVLLVFLLKSFSAEGDIFAPSSGLTLPVSSAIKKPEQAARVSITTTDILMEGSAVVPVGTMMNRDDMMIGELKVLLDERRELTGKIAEQSTTVKFKGDVIIEADRKTQFKVLQRVMYTCGQAGFSNFQLLVIQKEG